MNTERSLVDKIETVEKFLTPEAECLHTFLGAVRARAAHNLEQGASALSAEELLLELIPLLGELELRISRG